VCTSVAYTDIVNNQIQYSSCLFCPHINCYNGKGVSYLLLMNIDACTGGMWSITKGSGGSRNFKRGFQFCKMGK